MKKNSKTLSAKAEAQAAAAIAAIDSAQAAASAQVPATKPEAPPVVIVGKSIIVPPMPRKRMPIVDVEPAAKTEPKAEAVKVEPPKARAVVLEVAQLKAVAQLDAVHHQRHLRLVEVVGAEPSGIWFRGSAASRKGYVFVCARRFRGDPKFDTKVRYAFADDLEAGGSGVVL